MGVKTYTMKKLLVALVVYAIVSLLMGCSSAKQQLNHVSCEFPGAEIYETVDRNETAYIVIKGSGEIVLVYSSLGSWNYFMTRKVGDAEE